MPTRVQMTIVISAFTMVVLAVTILLIVRGEQQILGLIASALVGLAGTVLAAYIAINVAHHQVHTQKQLDEQSHREDLTFDLHRDFSSDVLLRARAEADKLTLRNYGESYKSLYERLPEQETRCLFLVTDFYERLWASIHSEPPRVEVKLVPQLFGPLFIWWYVNCFESRIIRASPEWSVAKHLADLHSWFVAHAEAANWQDWMNRAEDDEKRRTPERAKEETQKWERVVRHPVTTKLIDEFFSDGFLRHRIAVAGLRRKWLANEVPMRDIASGFWVGGTEPVYTGATHADGLNEHQHLEALLGYVRRLAFFTRSEEIDTRSLTGIMGSSFVWYNDFLLALAAEIERQAGGTDEGVDRNAEDIQARPFTAAAIRLVCSEIMGAAKNERLRLHSPAVGS